MANLKLAEAKDFEKKKKEIVDALAGESQLRSKKQLIEKFISENLPNLSEESDIETNSVPFGTSKPKQHYKHYVTKKR